jgi:uncharacterized protein YndB with AHSA1/START domain
MGHANSARRRITLERWYHTTPGRLWELCTTVEGIESWWGPEGFAVTVGAIDLRQGGELRYTMTATGPAQVAFMTRSHLPLSTPAMATYLEVSPYERLRYASRTDFVPGVEPYEVHTTVGIHPAGDVVHLEFTFDAMHDEEWTQRETLGHEEELSKLDHVIGAFDGRSGRHR